MYRAKLKPLLASGTFHIGDVSQIISLGDNWYRNEASLASFVFLSIFRDLYHSGWNDPQGVPTDDFNRFVTDVLPRANAVLAALPGEPVNELRALVLDYHSYN